MALAVEPSLPVELEREIFETAAMRHPKLIPTLLQVCHRVHAWVEPLLYRVVCITGFYKQLSLLSAIQSKPPTFLRNSVHYLLFPLRADIIKAIENIISGSARLISLFVEGALGPDHLLLLDELRPRRLHLSLLPSDDWPGPPWTRSILNSPLLSSVTHLELFMDMIEEARWEDSWSPLAALPALTHLCLPEELAGNILRAALAECPRLMVAISGFWVSTSPDYIQEFVAGLAVTDPRVVVMVVLDYERDWETGARGGDDFWTRAEAFVARKRKGEIESSCYFLDESASPVYTAPPSY